MNTSPVANAGVVQPQSNSIGPTTLEGGGGNSNATLTPALDPKAQQAAGIAAIEQLTAVLNKTPAALMNQTPGSGIDATQVASANRNNPALQAFQIGQCTTLTSGGAVSSASQASQTTSGLNSTQQSADAATAPKEKHHGGVKDVDDDQDDSDDPDDPDSPFYEPNAALASASAMMTESVTQTSSAPKLYQS